MLYGINVILCLTERRQFFNSGQRWRRTRKGKKEEGQEDQEAAEERPSIPTHLYVPADHHHQSITTMTISSSSSSSSFSSIEQRVSHVIMACYNT